LCTRPQVSCTDKEARPPLTSFRGSTVGDVFRKVMGDVPLAYVETTGGVRVSEEDQVVTGKNDVGNLCQLTHV
jgi:hypothetical protein